MELVGEDGSAIELQEGRRQELGRGAGGEGDASVSRLHVIVELLRPASRKGKEVVGESPALQLRVQVLGRNPICVVGDGGRGGGGSSPRVKFVRRGGNEWLALGDKFALSIRRPAFLSLRQSGGGRRGKDRLAQNSNGGGAEKARGGAGTGAMGEEAEDDEEAEIARAVARRERRTREREQERRKLLGEQKQTSGNGVRRDLSEAAGEPACQPTHASLPSDAASEFGFVVEGAEFEMYEKQGKADDSRAWSWKLDKGKREGDTDDEGSVEDSKPKAKSQKGRNGPAKRANDEESDDEWGGDDEEEEQSMDQVKGRASATKFATRSTRSAQKSTPPSLGKAAREPKAVMDMSDFIVDNSEDEEDEKPACKYGSKCYRKNKEHLSQFSHPEQ